MWIDGWPGVGLPPDGVSGIGSRQVFESCELVMTGKIVNGAKQVLQFSFSLFSDFFICKHLPQRIPLTEKEVADCDWDEWRVVDEKIGEKLEEMKNYTSPHIKSIYYEVNQYGNIKWHYF